MAERGLAILLIAVLICGWRVYDRHQARRLVRLRALADDFYPRCNALLDDPRMTEGMLSYLLDVALVVANPQHANAWARGMLNARRNGCSHGSRDNPLAMDPKFGGECIQAMFAGLFLLAEMRPFPGFVIRHEVARLQRKMVRDPSTAAPVMRRWVDIERRLEAA